ncbi:peptidyl-tRNA hydrolase [Rhodofomes roseus]|uniref:Peptidyl-tRNA hydrolase n=1 Tax=Rhodofomes roseus TaxID=34475 RepID=A0ABQ8KM32_9APHY|nr:peptidyl-tRNA hydrolase [Rhodofomes roseus]KAH9839261.1 peptidyl-tRNA hydrolase [Rhodofomes roseus]
MLSGSSHWLVVGLGNLPYPGTRHSIGHLVLDSLASRLGVSFTADASIKGFRATRYNAHIDSNDVTITLYKPKALMNISGSPVAYALKTLSIQPANMIVVHDSLDHKPMKLSPKFGGSASGQNGVRSIIAALGGTKDFHRLRIGIGRDQSDPVDYVMGRLSSTERAFWQHGEGTDAVWSALLKIMATPH